MLNYEDVGFSLGRGTTTESEWHAVGGHTFIIRISHSFFNSSRIRVFMSTMSPSSCFLIILCQEHEISNTREEWLSFKTAYRSWQRYTEVSRNFLLQICFGAAVQD